MRTSIINQQQIDIMNVNNYDNGNSGDIEDVCGVTKKRKIINHGTIAEYGEIVKILIGKIQQKEIATRDQVKEFLTDCRKTHKKVVGMKQALHVYRLMCEAKEFEYDNKYEILLSSNVQRAASGVLVIAVFTAPYPSYRLKNEIKIPNKYWLFAYLIYCIFWQNLLISMLPLILWLIYHYFNQYTIVTQQFSCQYNCFYCPNEPEQPRSYVRGEPGVDRANDNHFDVINQFNDRARSYYHMGHLDANSKIELLVLGGTWSSYPEAYQEEFIRDIYYAANTYFDNPNSNKREKYDSDTEIRLNEKATLRIIGLTLETRPDRITSRELKRYRRFGVTRIQMGIQHIDDDILYRINRECTRADAIKAIKMCKDAGFKVVGHWMPDLPQPLKPGISNKKETFAIDEIDGSVNMMDRDRIMGNTVATDPNWQVDEWKWYPTAVMKNTPLYTDYHNGSYKPYGDQTSDKEWTPLCDLCLEILPKIPEWVRLDRFIRDIPEDQIHGGHHDTNLRGKMEKMLREQGTPCRDIRYREVKQGIVDPNAELKVVTYDASQGTEYFLQFVSSDNNILYGFLRLRLTDNAGAGVFEELENCALIREVHVYGRVLKVGENNEHATQHSGFGKRLVNKSIEIARDNGYTKIAVIAGVGAREYYRKKFGFEIDGEGQYMTLNI